jgi:hypothetical protein
MRYASVHPEAVFLPDTGVAPLPKNAHVPTYAEFMTCGYFFVALAPWSRTKILVSGWTLCFFFKKGVIG